VFNTKRHLFGLASDVAVAVASEPFRVHGNKMAFQVILAPADLVDLEGSLDGFTWVNLNYDNAAGAYTMTALAAVGPGYYEVFERPVFVRIVVNIDAGGPRDFRAVLIVKTDLN
jgi:hypothetical protein